MEGGLIEWLPALLLLAVAVGLAMAYSRLNSRVEQVEHDRDGHRQVVDQANDAVLVLDLVSGHIHRANPRAVQLLGHEQGGLQAKTIFDLHFPEDLDRSARRIADAWAAGGLVYDDIPFRSAAGDRLPMECSVKVGSYAGQPAIVLYARDIRERLRLQNEVAEKTALVEHQNAEMRSGLRYARGIQTGMLPSMGQLRGAFTDAFVIFRPRDIVSGDFYWSAQVGRHVVVAAADCTGHGVPGALLSMTGIALLQQVVVGRGFTDPAQVLGALRAELLRALVHQDGEAQLRDGMNMGLLCFDVESREVAYSGALCPLYVLRKDGVALEEVKGDRMPVGYAEGELAAFVAHTLALASGDRLFLASDGFADQFGGKLGKKLKTSGLKEWLVRTRFVSHAEQGRLLDIAFTEWMGANEQVDDVLLLGLEI
jgi:PAS domain S-box-containing protein